MFLNVNASYSNYKFSFESGQDDFQFGFNSGIVDWTQKAQLSWYPNLQHEVRAGVEHVFHEFVPTSFFFRKETTSLTLGRPRSLTAMKAQPLWKMWWISPMPCVSTLGSAQMTSGMLGLSRGSPLVKTSLCPTTPPPTARESW
jgi:hypothetical protein